jgi:hypothetical protein
MIMADPVKVVCICGSLRKKSFNAALARQAPGGRVSVALDAQSFECGIGKAARLYGLPGGLGGIVVPFFHR